MDETQMRLALRSLCITRPLLKKGPVHDLLQLLDAATGGKPPAEVISAWGRYAASLLPYDSSLEQYLIQFLSGARNVLVENALHGQPSDEQLLRQIKNELALLDDACSLSAYTMSIYLDYDGPLPQWKNSKPDLFSWYSRLLESISSEGFGIFRDWRMFTVSHGHITPVRDADPVRLAQLRGYDWQRELVLRNVRALLGGAPASDMLLYGDSGTGKSSTIKAAANEFGPEGLRLIEVRPSQLHHIPQLLSELSENPLKFIIFIDDLSFTHEDDNFRALKGILEGSVLRRADNTIVAATSNRRRLIREAFSDRGNDDVHANETIQQQTALSDRFGLSIPFMDPGKDEYLRIVKAAAEEAGLVVPDKELFDGAERFALEKGGRSGRAARQYVNQAVVAGGQFGTPAAPASREMS